MYASTRIRRALAAGLPLLCLSACAHYEASPLDPARIEAAYVDRDLSSGELHDFLRTHAPQLTDPWPRSSWNLEALTLAAFCFHPELDVARAHFEVARAGIEVAAMRPSPSLTLAPSYNSDAAGATSPWLPGASLEIPIETASKRSIRITRAQHVAQSARSDLVTTAWRVRAALSTALRELEAQSHRARLTEQQLATQQHIVSLLSQRVSLGAAPSGEWSAANIALTRLQVASIESQQRLTEARRALAEALGVPARAVNDIHVDNETPSAIVLDVTRARSTALQFRSDILSGLADYAATEAELRYQIARQYPDLRFGPAFEWDQGERKWTLGVTLELPLNRNRPAIAEARARREESAARFRALEVSVIAEVESSIVSFESARAEVVRLQILDQALDRKLALEQARLTSGDSDQLQFQQATLERLEGALALLDGRLQVARAAGALESAIQQPIPALAVLEAKTHENPRP